MRGLWAALLLLVAGTANADVVWIDQCQEEFPPQEFVFDPNLEDVGFGFSEAEVCRRLIDEANANCTGKRCMGCLSAECNCACMSGQIGCGCFVFAEECPGNDERPDCDETDTACFRSDDPFSDDLPDPRDP